MNPEIYAAEAYNNYQHHQKKNNQPPLPSIFNIGCGPPDERNEFLRSDIKSRLLNETAATCTASHLFFENKKIVISKRLAGIKNL